MKGRDWILVLMAGLCGGLVPACTHTAKTRTTGTAEATMPAELDEPVTVARSGSPYSPMSVSTPKAEAPALVPVDRPIEPVHYPEAAPKVEAPRADGTPKADLWPIKPAVPAVPAAPDVPPAQTQPAQAVKPTTVGPTPVQAAPPLSAALHCFMDKRPGEAVRLLANYDNPELLGRLLQLAARLGESSVKSDAAQETEALIAHLSATLSELRARAALIIDKMCFCRRIETFGVYEPLPEDHVFRPGELVRVYVELKNFTSERRETVSGHALYVTQLASTAEIRDYSGRQVWEETFHRDRPEQSQTPRQDYYDHYRFCLPELPPERYTLWIKVTDLPTQRSVRRSLDFRVGAVGANVRN